MCVLFDGKIRTVFVSLYINITWMRRGFPQWEMEASSPTTRGEKRWRDRGEDVEGAGEIEKETERGIDIEGER